MNNFEYRRPADITEAKRLVAEHPQSMYIAGGTNLVDLWKYDLTHPDILVDVNYMGAGPAVLENANGCMLNAFATNADTAYHPVIETKYPLLSKAILAGASAQIRNMATNGGNLLQRTRCYYFYDAASPCNKRDPGSGCPAISGFNRMHAVLGAGNQCIAVFPSDMCVALAALDAKVHVSGREGNKIISFVDFHRLPGNEPQKDNHLMHGEMITAIELPKEGFSENYSYLKLRDRHSYAFALVSVATGLQLENGLISRVAIALGGVAHKPWRVPAAEEFLRGKSPVPENFSAAADIIMAGAVGYTHNNFKIGLAKKAIVRNCMTALQPGTQLPGARPSL